MAKIKMPLYSLSAKGSIGKGALTFSSTRTRTHAKYTPSWSRKHLAQVRANNNLFREAQKYWNWLPEYAKWYWNNNTEGQHFANLRYGNAYTGSVWPGPWRAVITGRNLFFQRAIPYIKAGLRPRMTPYKDWGTYPDAHSSPARIFWDPEPVVFISE
jgi:hypothetical protein